MTSRNAFKTFFVLLLVAPTLLLGGCGGTEASMTSAQQSPTSSQGSDYLNYELTQEFSFQGVTIKGDPSWTVEQPKDCNYYVHIDRPKNSNIAIQTVLYGQTETLDGAWAEFTNASNAPTTEDSWSKDGVDYHAGSYANSAGNPYLLLSGCEPSTGKGFLLWLSLDKDNWNSEESRKLFNDVRGTLSYDPSQTTMDFKEASTGKTHAQLVAESQSSAASSSGTQSAATPQEKAYTDGTYKVGTDIPAGEYKLTATSSTQGYWEVTDSSAADAAIVGNENFSGSTYVTVSEGQYLRLKRCTAAPAS